MEKLLPISEAAKFLGISTRGVYEVLRSGRLRFVRQKVRGTKKPRRFIRESELERYQSKLFGDEDAPESVLKSLKQRSGMLEDVLEFVK